MDIKEFIEVLDNDFNKRNKTKKIEENKILKDFDNQINEKEVLSKIGSAVKRGWERLKGKIKEVWKAGFRLGVAIGKTFSGKYVLFNKKGEILVPEAEKIGYDKLGKTGKKVLTLVYRLSKIRNSIFKIRVNDKLSFGFGSGITNDGVGVIYVVSPKKPGINEGIDYTGSEILTEATTEDEDLEIISRAESEVYASFTGPGSEALKYTEDNPVKIAPVEVDYDDFKRELTTLMDMVAENEVMSGGKVKVIGIYAPTGWGKTEIIKSAAEEKGFFYFPLELQKVDLNVIQGFPYLDNVHETENLLEDDKKARIRAAKKIVRLAPSQYLPPSGDPGKWLLFFDEFNRADSEKMAAVMNLLLTGELGGAAELVRNKSDKEELDRYKLPEKTVVVLAMNTGTQEGIEDSMNLVKNLDIATLERVHRIVFGRYNLTSWLKNYAEKPFKLELKSGVKKLVPWRIHPILKSYMIEVYKKALETKSREEALEAPFLIKIKVASKGSREGGGGERTISPRSWTVVADRMFEEGWARFKELPEETKNIYRKEADKIKAMLERKGFKDLPKDEDEYTFAAYMSDAKVQIELLANQTAEFGEDGKEIVEKIINSFLKRGRMNLNEEEILLNYKAVRNVIENGFVGTVFGTKAKLFTKFYLLLKGFKTPEELENYMERRSYPIIDKNGIVSQLYKTIKDLYEKLKVSADELFSFAYLIESEAKKRDNELLRQLHAKLVGNWKTYEDSIKSKLKTPSQIAKELEDLTGEKESVEKNESLDVDNDLLKVLEVIASR